MSVLHNPEFWANVEVVRKLQAKKLCIAADRDNCKGSIVEAHTIPKSQLRHIATNGKVYEIAARAVDLARNSGSYSYRERGIGEFSVLNCFCEKHDREIFSPVENEKLIFGRRQLSILHYRAMGAELYKKANAVEISRHVIKHSKAKKRHQAATVLEAVLEFQMLGMRDIGTTLSHCERAVFSDAFEEVSGLVIRFERKPTVMTVGGFTPEYDYNGALVTRMGIRQPAVPQIGLSLLATADGAAAIFTWLHYEEKCRAFAETLVGQPSDLLTTLLIQTCFEQIENTCMNIPWWDSLASAEKDALLRRAQSGTPRQERISSCLQFDGVRHDQWHYNSHFFIN